MKWGFVFPSNRLFAWPSVSAPVPSPGPQFVFPGPGPQFVFTGSGPQFVFPGPGPQFVFTGSGPQFVFTGPVPQFVFTGPGSQFIFTGPVAQIILLPLDPNLCLPTLTETFQLPGSLNYKLSYYGESCSVGIGQYV